MCCVHIRAARVKEEAVCIVLERWMAVSILVDSGGGSEGTGGVDVGLLMRTAAAPIRITRGFAGAEGHRETIETHALPTR